jgi:hypothetical protein
VPCRGPSWPDAPWSPGPLVWGQSPPGTAGSPQGSIPPGSPQPASLSLQLATKPGLFWSLPSPSGKTGRRPRSSEGHFSPQHFHRLCWGDELQRQLDGGSWLDGPPAGLSGSAVSLQQLFHRPCWEAGEHRETPQRATSGVTGQKAGAAAPGRAGSQASRQPSNSPPPRRASPTRGQSSLEAVRVPSGRRPRPLRARDPVPPLRRAIGRCYRQHELPLVRGRGAGRARRGLHNRGRVGGCKGPRVPYITRGSGEGGSRPILAKWSGLEDNRAGPRKSTAGLPGGVALGLSVTGGRGPRSQQVSGPGGACESAGLWGSPVSQECSALGFPLFSSFQNLLLSPTRQYR